MSCSPNLLSSPPSHEPVEDEIHYSRIHSISDHCLLTMIALKIRVLESMSQLERSHDQKDEATFVSKSVRLDLGKSRRRKGGAGRIGADCCYPSLSYSMLRCWLNRLLSRSLKADQVFCYQSSWPDLFCLWPFGWEWWIDCTGWMMFGWNHCLFKNGCLGLHCLAQYAQAQEMCIVHCMEIRELHEQKNSKSMAAQHRWIERMTI